MCTLPYSLQLHYRLYIGQALLDYQVVQFVTNVHVFSFAKANEIVLLSNNYRELHSLNTSKTNVVSAFFIPQKHRQAILRLERPRYRRDQKQD